MRHWVRATIETRCEGWRHQTGEQPRWIAKGELMQEIRIVSTKRRLVRCVDCAGPAPAELQPVNLMTPSPATGAG